MGLMEIRALSQTVSKNSPTFHFGISGHNKPG
jgi:hypothetical protein